MDGMIALIVSADNVIDKEIDFLTPSFPEFANADLRIFSETSGAGMFPPDSSVIGSAYFIPQKNLFRKIAIGRNMRIFRSIWGDAFYSYVNRLLAEDGEILAHCEFEEDRARKFGYYSYADLQKLFGQEGSYDAKTQVAIFRKRLDFPKTVSTLNQLVENCGAVVLDSMTLYNVPDAINVARYDDIYLECLLDQAEALVQRPRDWVGRGNRDRDKKFFTLTPKDDDRVPEISFGANFSGTLASVSYLFAGTKYKMPLLKNIIQKHVKIDHPYGAIDFGGGYGHVTAELLLDPDLNLNRGVVCDFSTIYTTQAGNLYRYFRNELRGRFFYSSAKMQEFKFDQKYGVISALSSFLYCPKELRQQTLQNFWDNLEPGGVLIIFEVPKNSTAYKDYDKQFVADEIDGHLAAFGEVHRYAATSILARSKEEAGEAPVFRAVAKPLG